MNKNQISPKLGQVCYRIAYSDYNDAFFPDAFVFADSDYDKRCINLGIVFATEQECLMETVKRNSTLIAEGLKK